MHGCLGFLSFMDLRALKARFFGGSGRVKLKTLGFEFQAFLGLQVHTCGAQARFMLIYFISSFVLHKYLHLKVHLHFLFKGVELNNF